MQYRDREGFEIGGDSTQDLFLRRLYGTAAGRLLVRILIRPAVSRFCGRLLDMGWSKMLIGPFARSAGIRLDECVRTDIRAYRSYNDFFCREARPGCRPVEQAPDAFISPCDGKLSVYPVGEHSGFQIKNTRYTVRSLLRSRRLAEKYRGGYVCIFRLEVGDYHRYCYVEGGLKSKQRAIPGVFHTVNPVAGEAYPIYKENAREYCLIKTGRAGLVAQMEVGALMVGKISNLCQGRAQVRRGEEKGRFEFGGSTVVVITEPGKVQIDRDLLDNTVDGFETAVRLGERIGTASGRGAGRRV